MLSGLVLPAGGGTAPARPGNWSSGSGSLRRRRDFRGPLWWCWKAQPGGGVSEGGAGGVEVVHASGPGDDVLVALAAGATKSGGPVVLVSADRGLGRRARAVGAEVVSPGWLLAQLQLGEN
jgi:hypothetical protein